MFVRAKNLFVRIITLRDVRGMISRTKAGKITLSLVFSATSSIAKIGAPAAFFQAATLLINRKDGDPEQSSIAPMMLLFCSVTLTAWTLVESQLKKLLLVDCSESMMESYSDQLWNLSKQMDLSQLDSLTGDFIAAEFAMDECSELPQTIINELFPPVFDIFVGTYFIFAKFDLAMGAGFLTFAAFQLIVINNSIAAYLNLKQKKTAFLKSRNDFLEHKFDILSNAELVRTYDGLDYETLFSEDSRSEYLSVKNSLQKAETIADILAIAPQITINFALLILNPLTLQNAFLLAYFNIYGLSVNQANTAFRRTVNILDLLDEKVCSLLQRDYKMEVELKSSAKEIKSNAPEIKINVSFNHGQKHILDGLNLSIKSAETIALVGPSGSGKTTTAHMLLKLVQPTSGVITFNDININHLPLQQHRQNIAYLSQKSTHFRLRTIEENINYGSAGKDSIKLSIKNYHTFDSTTESKTIMDEVELKELLPRKLETPATLSGGERQRVSLGRLLLKLKTFKNVNVVILDEPLTSLDGQTASSILNLLKRYTQDKTTIHISHQLWTIQHVDTIHVLMNGKIVESGTHSELLALKGQYRQYWDNQSKACHPERSEGSLSLSRA